MHKLCWVITDGSAGMENQAWGLAEALNYHIIIKRISLRNPWLFFAPYLRIGKRFCLDPSSDPLTPPWPELIIACGRRSIPPSLYVKEASKNKTKLIYLQNPKISPKLFDAIICPQHDNLKGSNIIPMIGATHRVTEDHLNHAYSAFSSVFSHYPSPRYTVLIGGPNRVFEFTPTIAQHIAHQLIQLQKRNKASLLISPSRRTPKKVIEVFKEAFAENPRIYFWDGVGENPYFALLVWADIILLTCDSVNMASEACFTTKPVYLIKLPGGSKKFATFHDQLLKMKRVRWFNGNVESFKAKSFNENFIITEKLKNLLKLP